MAKESSAGFWFVLGSPRTRKALQIRRCRVATQFNFTRTKQSLGAEGSHYMWHGIVKERNSHGVLHWHLSTFVRQQRSVLKRSHGIEPGFWRAVNQAAVDPRCHLVNLNVGVESLMMLASRTDRSYGENVSTNEPVRVARLDFVRYFDRTWRGGTGCSDHLDTPCRTSHHIFLSRYDASRWDIRIQTPSQSRS